MSPQGACERAVNQLDQELRKRRGEAGDLSVIAMNQEGEWGAATNIKEFTVVVETETEELAVYQVIRQPDGHCRLEKATQEWVENEERKEIASA